ncbi:hypothetical protein F1714_11780, partial [Streptococcus pneumoniae]
MAPPSALTTTPPSSSTTSYLEVADNTGARKIMCIRVLKGSNAKYATVGDIIVASVKEAIPRG